MTVEIDPESDPITGRLIDRWGTHVFKGWLELAAALQAAFDGSDADGLREA
jgi:hypothetical protein